MSAGRFVKWPGRTVGHVVTESGCWEFTGCTTLGYGRIKAGGRLDMAHRFIYEITNGPIPDGMQIDHLCRNRKCVRPDHLEPVTQRTNILRGVSPTARNALKERCKYGHDFSPHGSRSGRRCRECDKRHRALSRRSAQTNAPPHRAK